jgi:two-component system sensor histidine kinase/response regulator
MASRLSGGQSSVAPLQLLEEAERELGLARQKIESANRARAEFLSMMSHEFRTPMTAIVGMTDLLLLGEITADQRECLTTVRDAADNLMVMLNEVCDYVRAEAGLLDFEWTGFHLRNLLEEAVQPLAQRAHAKGLELVVAVGPSVPDLLVSDPRRVSQIVVNLLDSSIRLTKQGEVVLEVASEAETDDEVVLKFLVRDTGSGIAPEDRHRVVLPFMGSDRSLKLRYPLSPMGLPLAYVLVSALDGHFSLRSEPGRGTCFEASIRVLKQEDSRAQQRNLEPLRSLGLSNAEILIIDPHGSSREALCHLTSTWGLRPRAVADFDQAEAECSAGGAKPPAAILVDASQIERLPQSLERLVRQRGARPPVLLLLRSNQPSLDAEQCEALGIAATIRKPVFERELLEALMTLLQASQPTHGAPVLDSIALEVVCEDNAAIARLGGDVDLYKELVRCFVDDSSGLFAKIAQALQAGDAEGVHRAAHSLKGLAASCGATTVWTAAGKLERLAREGNLPQAETVWRELQAAFAATRHKLSAAYPA